MMRSTSLPSGSSYGAQLKLKTSAHFKRTNSHSSGDNSDVMLPGSPRRIRNNKKTSVIKEEPVITESNQSRTKHDFCSNKCAFKKSKEEVLVKSKPLIPDQGVPTSSQTGRRRSTGFGYVQKVEKLFLDVPDLESEDDSSDEDPAVKYGVEEDKEQDETARTKQLLTDQYRKICNGDGVTACGRYSRQINGPVVDISCSMLGLKDIKSICVSLATNYNIKDIDLSGNDLSGKGAKYLAEVLRENTSIIDLTLERCNLDFDGLKAIADVFLDMKPMKRLDFSKNKFQRRHAELIASIIQKNDYIEDLILSGNEFDEAGGVLLGQALVRNVGIKTLDLSWNHLRRDGATAVCMALKHNQTLEELDLSWNGLAEEGCKALGMALPHNHTLKDLDISCNRINIFYLKEFLKGLVNNDTLHILRIDQNPISTDGAIGLMEALSRSDCSQITDIHMIDIPINEEFLESLDSLLKVRNVRVFHRDPNRKKITPIIRERTLKDYDPAMVLFEYMKQENLRLIDLFRTFDTDGDQSVSKEELREGFMTINMPLSDDALENLFEKLDLNDNDQIEYDEYKVGYRNAMKKLRKGQKSEDENEASSMNQLKKLVKRALHEKREEAAMVRGYKQRKQRQASLTAVFAVKGDQHHDLVKRLQSIHKGNDSF